MAYQSDGFLEENQDVEQLFEEIMIENFPNLVKEMETQRIPKIRDPKRPIPRHIIIKMPKVKYKEKKLKAAREKQIITCDWQLISQERLCRTEELGKKYSKE